VRYIHERQYFGSASSPTSRAICRIVLPALQWRMPAPETLTLRATAIAGQRYADDYAVIWHGMSVGRIMLGNGAPHDRPQWIWSCHVHGRPQGGDDRGNAANLVDAKARFKNAWARIRASLNDQDIADAKQIAALSAEALAR
jgi:hypothetical protein